MALVLLPNLLSNTVKSTNLQSVAEYFAYCFYGSNNLFYICQGVQ
jgi:hypothetical protein